MWQSCVQAPPPGGLCRQIYPCRIVESLQSAVEKIPIREAFDELDADKDYHREKRKATNDQFISKKGIIGKFVGFAPMICLFVGYLIIPLVFIGLSSMGRLSEFNV